MHLPVRFQDVEPCSEDLRGFSSEMVDELVGVDIDATSTSFGRYDGEANVDGPVQPAAGHVRRRPRIHQYTAVDHEETLVENHFRTYSGSSSTSSFFV